MRSRLVEEAVCQQVLVVPRILTTPHQQVLPILLIRSQVAENLDKQATVVKILAKGLI